MRAFVTGGSGFVGRTLIAELRAAGHEVRALARSDGAAATVMAAGAEAVRGDLEDQAALVAAMVGCDVVFHAAAMVKDTGAEEEFLRINVGGTENVIAAARAAAVPRLVHVSTEAVLVGGPPLHDVDETRLRPAYPLGLYPRTKALAEDRVLAANGSGLATVVVRPRFIWGKGDTSLLPAFAAKVKAGKYRWIAGGRYPTSTCNVRNVCEGMMRAAERGRPGEVYFLTDGAPVEFRGFITAMLRTQGLDPGAKSVPRWVARAGAWAAEAAWGLFGLKGELPITRTAVRLIGEEVTVNDAKARREIGYLSKVTREEGLKEMEAPSSA